MINRVTVDNVLASLDALDESLRNEWNNYFPQNANLLDLMETYEASRTLRERLKTLKNVQPPITNRGTVATPVGWVKSLLVRDAMGKYDFNGQKGHLTPFENVPAYVVSTVFSLSPTYFMDSRSTQSGVSSSPTLREFATLANEYPDMVFSGFTVFSGSEEGIYFGSFVVDRLSEVEKGVLYRRFNPTTGTQPARYFEIKNHKNKPGGGWYIYAKW